MPFGYLEFSRAIGREPCPIMRARAAAGGGGRPAPAPGSGPGPGLGLGLGSLPGLVLFESGLKGMGRTRSDPLRYPIRSPTGVCERIQTARQRLSENRLCGWTGPLCGLDS